MSLVTHDAPVSSKRLWAGRIISALPALLLLFSGTMKLLKVPAVIEGMAHYGYPEHLILYIGMLEVGCTIVYLIPRTAIHPFPPPRPPAIDTGTTAYNTLGSHRGCGSARRGDVLSTTLASRETIEWCLN